MVENGTDVESVVNENLYIILDFNFGIILAIYNQKLTFFISLRFYKLLVIINIYVYQNNKPNMWVEI